MVWRSPAAISTTSLSASWRAGLLDDSRTPTEMASVLPLVIVSGKAPSELDKVTEEGPMTVIAFRSSLTLRATARASDVPSLRMPRHRMPSTPAMARDRASAAACPDPDAELSRIVSRNASPAAVSKESGIGRSGVVRGTDPRNDVSRGTASRLIGVLNGADHGDGDRAMRSSPRGDQNGLTKTTAAASEVGSRSRAIEANAADAMVRWPSVAP